MAECKTCQRPLTLEIDNEDDDDSGMETTDVVPDDVGLQCGCHYHWQCLIDSFYDLTQCPTCSSSTIQSQPSSSNAVEPSDIKILCSLNNEGGQQTDVDLFPVFQEECYLKTYPEERRARAFLEFCKEGDHQAAVEVLLAEDDEDDEDETTAHMDAHAILRYQDTLHNEQTALHIAAANGHREIVWLLLLLASEYPELEIPALVYQEAATLGIMREDQTDRQDIRAILDWQGRSAEDVARESGNVIWTGWLSNGRLSIS